MLIRNWLHQGLDEVLCRLYTEDRKHCSLRLDPQRFLVCARV